MGRGSAVRCRQEALAALKRGAWTAEEDQKLVAFIEKNKGHGSWRTLPTLAGLQRCGKSCRLRWINYLHPDIKRGNFSPAEERTITHLHALMGNKWSTIASHLPGRTDNEVKNHWNTHLKKRLKHMGLDPITHRPILQADGPRLYQNLHLGGTRQAHSLSPPLGHQGGRHDKMLRPLLDKSFVSHMAQWEVARLEAEARLSVTAFSSSRAPPKPIGPKQDPVGCLTHSANSQQDSNTFAWSNDDSSDKSSSPVLRRAALGNGGNDKAGLQGISNRPALAVSRSSVAARANHEMKGISDVPGFVDNCTSGFDQDCCASMAKPRLSEYARDEDKPPLQVEGVGVSSAGRQSCSSMNTWGCPTDADSTAVSVLRHDTTLATLLAVDLQMDAMTSWGPSGHHDILPLIEDQLLMPVSPDQPCLSGSTSFWTTQYLVDYMGLAMPPPRCFGCE